MENQDEKVGAKAPEITEKEFRTQIFNVLSKGGDASDKSRAAKADSVEVTKTLVRVLNRGVQANLSIMNAHKAVIESALSEKGVDEKVRTSRANFIGSPSQPGHMLFTALHNMGRLVSVKKKLDEMVTSDAIFVKGNKGILKFCSDERTKLSNIPKTAVVSREDFADILESLPSGETLDLAGRTDGALFPESEKEGSTRNARKFLEAQRVARDKMQAWISALDAAEKKVHLELNPRVRNWYVLPTTAEYREFREEGLLQK